VVSVKTSNETRGKQSEGSAQDADAQYARAHCFQTQEVGLVELITPEVNWFLLYICH